MKNHTEKPVTTFAKASRWSADIVACLFVGLVLGYFFDAYFQTNPWGMVVFIVLGFLAGIKSILKAACALNNCSSSIAAKKGVRDE